MLSVIIVLVFLAISFRSAASWNVTSVVLDTFQGRFLFTTDSQTRNVEVLVDATAITLFDASRAWHFAVFETNTTWIQANGDIYVSYDEAFGRQLTSIFSDQWSPISVAVSAFAFNGLTSPAILPLSLYYPSTPFECPCMFSSGDSTVATLRYLRCRTRCAYPPGIMPWMCSSTETFVPSLQSCVEKEALVVPGSAQELSTRSFCEGGTFSSLAKLQRLRFCNHVNGSIVIRDASFNIDPTIFWDVETITGSFMLLNVSDTVSIDGFGKLASIGVLPADLQTTSQYSVIIQHNPDLVNIDTLLQAFKPINRGIFGKNVFIANNDRLCANISTMWATMPNSWIEYNTSQCANPCRVYQSSSLCKSQCSDCPGYCQAVRLYDQTSLEFYSRSMCNIIIGTLFISSPHILHEFDLRAALSSIEVILGDLIVSANTYLSSLWLLQKLKIVDNIVIINNPNLVDARLPSLQSFSSIQVQFNQRLCPVWYPGVIGSISDLDCVYLQLSQTIVFESFNITAAHAISTISQLISLFVGPSAQVTTMSVDSALGYSISKTQQAVTITISNVEPSSPLFTSIGTALQSPHALHVSANMSLTISPLGSPKIAPMPQGYNDFVQLSGNITSEGIALQWFDPLAGLADLYIVQYAPRPSDADIELLITDFDLASPIEKYGPSVQDRVAFILDQGRIWNTFETEYSSNRPVFEAFINSSHLQTSTNALFDFRIVSFIDNFQFKSNTLTFSQLDPNFIVSNLTVASKATEIVLTWTAPNSDIRSTTMDFNLQGYVLTIMEDAPVSSVFLKQFLYSETTQYVVSCSSANSTKCIQGNSNYTISISAIRFNGIRGYPVVVSTKTAPNLPAFSPFVSVVSITATNVIFSVSAVDESYGIVQSIFVHFVSGPTSDVNISVNGFNSFQGQFRVDNILPYSNYSCQIVVETSTGLSEPSRPVQFETLETIPNTLAAPTVTLLPNGLEQITWFAPMPLPGVILYYEVAYWKNGAIGSPFQRSSDTSVTIVATSSFVVVRAATGQGVGPWSAHSLTIPLASSSRSVVSQITQIVLAVTLSTVILLAIAVAIFCVRRHPKETNTPKEKPAIIPELQCAFARISIVEPVIPREISSNDLTILGELGAGKFGVVCKAMLDENSLNGIPAYIVAVKTLNKTVTSSSDCENYFLEGAIMAQLRHPNILGLIGMTTQTEPLMLVSQFCEHGSLVDHLQAHGKELPVYVLVDIGVEIACGMGYLASIGVIHRDLAARNVLIGSDCSCKISDFGFARSVPVNEPFYIGMNDRVPVRWTAVEALQERKYSVASDCWSFGIVLHEIFGLGEKPYSEWPNTRVWNAVLEGYRLPQLPLCPDVAYALMTSCWDVDPNKRPSFAVLEQSLADLASSLQTSHSSRITFSAGNSFRSRGQQDSTHTGPTDYSQYNESNNFRPIELSSVSPSFFLPDDTILREDASLNSTPRTTHQSSNEPSPNLPTNPINVQEFTYNATSKQRTSSGSGVPLVIIHEAAETISRNGTTSDTLFGPNWPRKSLFKYRETANRSPRRQSGGVIADFDTTTGRTSSPHPDFATWVPPVPMRPGSPAFNQTKRATLKPYNNSPDRRSRLATYVDLLGKDNAKIVAYSEIKAPSQHFFQSPNTRRQNSPIITNPARQSDDVSVPKFASASAVNPQPSFNVDDELPTTPESIRQITSHSLPSLYPRQSSQNTGARETII